jgi:hypothetical protein
VRFTAIILCYVASQRVLIAVVYFVMAQSGNFWIYPQHKRGTLLVGSEDNHGE